jgi:hypothetical protein
MARWQSGHAAACKAVYAGSIPTLASIADKTKSALAALFCFSVSALHSAWRGQGMAANVACLVARKMETSKSEFAFTPLWVRPTVAWTSSAYAGDS